MQSVPGPPPVSPLTYPRRTRRQGLVGRACECCGKAGRRLYATPLSPFEDGRDRGEEVVIGEETSADVQDNKVAPDPFMPSATEVENHRVTHMPYRSWCRECVEGRALGERRQPRTTHESKIPVIGMDYFFMIAKGLLTRSELSDYPQTADGDSALMTARTKGELVKCLILRDSHTKCVFAHVVPVKGIDEDAHVVQLVVADVRWLGHTRLIVKADNEKAIQRLAREALRGIVASAEQDGVAQVGRFG